jgi:hypothetical protein
MTSELLALFRFPQAVRQPPLGRTTGGFPASQAASSLDSIALGLRGGVPSPAQLPAAAISDVEKPLRCNAPAGETRQEVADTAIALGMKRGEPVSIIGSTQRAALWCAGVIARLAHGIASIFARIRK